MRAPRLVFTATLGREPTLSELAAQTGLSPEEIACAEGATGSAQSLSSQSGEEPGSRATFRDGGSRPPGHTQGPACVVQSQTRY